ncbi:MAG: UPF0182 family protein [Clostridiales Family XIII bacterium]|nr:UPF0182 family protein [Clostridiales Family XIII bacterium]
MKNNDKIRKILITVIIVAVILIGLIVALTSFITRYLWFQDIGQTDVFWKKLLTQIELGVPTFIVISALAFFYFKALKRGYKKRVDVAAETLGHKVQAGVTWVLALASGGVMTYLVNTRLWYEFLQFTHSTAFGKDDPIFGNDISFYVFRLNFVRDLNSIIIMGVFVFAVATFLYYMFLLRALTPAAIDGEPTEEEPQQEEGQYTQGGMLGSILKSFGIGGAGGQDSPFGAGLKPKSQGVVRSGSFKEILHIASKQVIAIGVIFFLMIAVNYWLKQYDLLYSATGAVFGAGFTDINITLWVYRVIIALAFVAAVFFAIGVQKKKVRTMLTVPVIMIVVSLAGTGVSMLVQNFVVEPDELNKEASYLQHNIEYTQNAYGLQDVVVKPFPADNDLTSEQIQANMDTIRNIRINDYDPAKTFYNSTQTIRQYYTFNDVDVDRYMVNGEYTQTFLSAREIDEKKIPQTWVNQHLIYTHGYGVTLSRVDKVTASGQPDIMIKDIPPVSQVEEIEITQPQIYFGELQNEYILTNTKENEFDYPEGNDNKYSTYTGEYGIKMNAFNRFMFAIQERSLKLLVSSNITSDSKLIINRNVKQRVQTIMPYLDYSDPYLVTVDGKLFWMIDAYTTSTEYPYSEPYNAAGGNASNYIRNSVKVTIDAYTGETNYYLVDEADPVAKTMQAIYPSLFKDFDSMPEGLKAHIRYPGTMLNVQANIYKKYHVDNYKVFYQGEDRWDIANEKVGASEKEVPMTPNYYIMKLPGEKDVEFINSIPFTPMNKVNMMALFVARNDGEHYGELIAYQLPKSKLVMGPSQIDAQIAQDTDISRDFSFWENSGSTYLRGNMFVIPIENSIMYVEPIYLKASEGSLPEVKRIVLYYGDRIAYEATLAEALNSMFGAGSGDALIAGQPTGDTGDADASPGDQNPDTGSPGDSQQINTDQLIKNAVDAYNAALEAQKAGDWAKYGTEIEKLKGYLDQLNGTETAAAAAATDAASTESASN